MMELCPECDSANVSIVPGLDVFPFEGEMLRARVDFYTCEHCGFIYTGVQRDLARAEAIKQWVQQGVS